jgi:phosphatidylglycerophosphatase A
MAIGLLLIVGAWSGSVAERHFKATDPGPVVVDEVLGMLVTLLAVPVGWGAVLIGFFVFRLFDVIKPYPANRLERLPGGLGMMADDLMAAVYANLVLRAVLSAGDLLA